VKIYIAGEVDLNQGQGGVQENSHDGTKWKSRGNTTYENRKL